MHIILGALTSIVTILYLLDRLGVDLGWLNPFSFLHRRKWRHKFEGDPIYAIEDPLEIAAVTVVGIARVDGDMTVEMKASIREQFASTFSLSEKAASDLIVASSHLLGSPQIIPNQLDGLLKRGAQRFSPAQSDSILKMLDTLYGGAESSGVREAHAAVRELLKQEKGPSTEWAKS